MSRYAWGQSPLPNTPFVRTICTRMRAVLNGEVSCPSANAEDRLHRAFKAYVKTGAAEQPSVASGEQQVDGLTYVVLRNVNGPLAVYRVRTDGALMRLKRWPAALN